MVLVTQHLEFRNGAVLLQGIDMLVCIRGEGDSFIDARQSGRDETLTVKTVDTGPEIDREAAGIGTDHIVKVGDSAAGGAPGESGERGYGAQLSYRQGFARKPGE